MLVLGLALHYFVSWLSQCICLIRRIPLQWKRHLRRTRLYWCLLLL